MYKPQVSTLPLDSKSPKLQVFKAPWGWSFRVFDDKGKQIFSGTLYESEIEATAAGEKFLSKNTPN